MALDISELQELVTPIDRMVLKYLQENRKGATIMEIVRRVKSEMGEDADDIGRTVSGVLAKGTELGFIERDDPRRKASTSKAQTKERECSVTRRRSECGGRVSRHRRAGRGRRARRVRRAS